jgi:dihydroxyacetone kinase
LSRKLPHPCAGGEADEQVPGTRSGESHLGADEYELGMGIHNEPGTQKLPLKSTADLIDNMLSKITDTTDKDRSFVPFKGDGSDEVVLLVNDLGSISELEMGGITNEGMSFAK